MASIETYAKPVLLYRYRSLGLRMSRRQERVDDDLFEREIVAIEEDYIYCPTYTAMNDPMEGLYKASRRVERDPDYDEVVEEIRNEKLGLGIASLCEAWDNELMWAHYANGFRGICVAYWMGRLVDNLSPAYAFSRVAYGDKPFSVNTAVRRNRAERARAVLSTKNLRWAYEREWRLFAPQQGPAHHGANVVAHVYLGARFPDADRARITRRLENVGISVRPTQVDGYRVEREGGITS